MKRQVRSLTRKDLEDSGSIKQASPLHGIELAHEDDEGGTGEEEA